MSDNCHAILAVRTMTYDKPKHAGAATTVVVKVSLSMDLLLENAFAWIQTNITAINTITSRLGEDRIKGSKRSLTPQFLDWIEGVA